MHWQHVLAAQKADRNLHHKKCGQHVEEPLYSTLLRPHLELCPALESSAQDGRGPAGRGQQRGTKMIRGVEHISYEDRLRELALFSLEKRRLQGDFTAVFQYLKGAYRRDGEGLFMRECSDRTRGDGFKLEEERFRLYIRKRFFTVRVLRHWNRLPREVVEAPSLEMLKHLSNPVRWELSLPIAGWLKLVDL
ncbi:hypothetical protein llap_382 [Limosa lapponica baueri]|uniref:Uncharacterized protein n=1 Tax=Limosa lapponica baueri TaxID=1758121 RepID=A0A2I0UTF9_LIMLA|nr:hypothetical protein llap_382 [Limosa lapponica baueri]